MIDVHKRQPGPPQCRGGSQGAGGSPRSSGPQVHLSQTHWVPLSAMNRCICTMAAQPLSSSIEAEMRSR
jgi:hypothetical protein